MTGGDPFLTGTQPGATGEAAAQPSYLVSSAGQSSRDEVSNGPAAAESDSGDSLFLTQKEATLPEAVRSAHRRYTSRSTPTSPRDLEESEGDNSSTCHSKKWKRGKKKLRPNYSFPFLKQRECKRRRSPLFDLSQSIDDYTIRGFFKCLGELRPSSGQTCESSLPTIDTDGEDISPLSEEDGETPEDEDIKVVERKHFLASFKKISQQSWCNPLKRQKRRRDNNAGRETSGRRETKPSHIKQNKKSFNTENPGTGSCRVLVQRTREASEPAAGQAGDGPGSQLLLHELPDHSSITQVKKRTKEWSEGLHAAMSVNVEAKETFNLSEVQTSAVKMKKKKKKKRRKDSSEDAEQLQSETVAEPVSDDAEIKKKKKKKRKASSEDADELQSEAVAKPLSEDAEKKKKASAEDDAQLQFSAVAEPLSEDAEIKKKKKKRRRKGSSEDAEELQSEAVAKLTSEDAEIQKKRRRKGSGEDAEELLSEAVAEPPCDDAQIKKKKKKMKKRKGCGEDVEQLQAEAVAEPLSEDAEMKKKKRSRKASGDDAEKLQSSAVAEPLSEDAEIQKEEKKRMKKRKGSGKDAEELESSAVAEPLSDDAEMQKKKKKKRRKASSEDAEELQSDAVTKPLSEDAEKKKKKKASADDVEQLQFRAVAEPLSEDAEMKKKKKKRKRKGSSEDAEELLSETVAEPLSDDAEIQKKKEKKKKELVIVIRKENEETLKRTLDLPPVSTEQFEASGNCSQEPLGSSLERRKKHQKKQQSTNDGDEDVDLSVCLDESLAEGSGTSLKKKKKKRKTVFEEMNVSYTPKEKEKFETISEQKTNEGLEEQNAELVTKEKKRKSEPFSTGASGDKVAQSDDSVSAREKEKRRHSSFLFADAEERDAQTHRERIPPSPSRPDVEEPNDGVTQRKHKRKSKTSVTECADAGRKREKERTGSESKGLDGAADAGSSAHDEVLKKKKKKKKKCNDVIMKDAPTAKTCSPVSRKEKGKCDANAETLTSVERELPSSETLSDTRDQKKKKLLLKSDWSESEETKKEQKERSEPPLGLFSAEAADILRREHRMLMRKFLNPN